MIVDKGSQGINIRRLHTFYLYGLIQKDLVKSNRSITYKSVIYQCQLKLSLFNREINRDFDQILTGRPNRDYMRL